MMVTAGQNIRDALSGLAFLMEYPADDFRARVESLADLPPEAAAHFSAFAEIIRGMEPDAIEELYSRTFDLAPLCMPYVSIQVLGEESNQRTKLMTGLLNVYRQPGFVSGVELPDHLSLVLKNAPQFSDEEWREFREFCLDKALEKMTADLAKPENPYAHVLRGIAALLALEKNNAA